MTKTISIALGLAAMLAPAAASAQEASSSDIKSFAVVGTVPGMCTGGTIAGGNATFDLGVLIDTTTGLLRNNLSAPAKVITGSFCSTRSTINVIATPIVAQNFVTTPPTGFSRSVDYTATASGWTVTPASFSTASSANAAATQTRDTSFTGDISVGIGSFATTGGAALRMVADTAFRGTVTVTLTAVN